MKLKNHLLLSGIALFAASCSNNDDDDNQEMTLKRVEEYYPSKEAYNDAEWQFGGYKDVKYYENGEVVLDSFFDSTTSYYSREVIQTIGNTKVKTHYDISNNTLSTVTYSFDTTGRLLEIINTVTNQSPSINTYSYQPDGSINHTIQNSLGELYLFSVYTTNSEGLIANRLTGDGIITYQITYENGNVMDADFSYYDIAKPSNMQMTTIQSNNYILEHYVSDLFEISKQYIKADSNTTFESTFNNSGYILHTNWHGEMGSGMGTKEIFYYYN